MKTARKTHSNSTASLMAAALFAAAFAAGTGTVSAGQPDEVLTKTVYYGDLNLESQQGAKALYYRLRSAARQVCAPYESLDLSLQSAWRSCVDYAMDGAVAKINKPMVSALHNQTAGHSKNS
jgi:UrcA family protein